MSNFGAKLAELLERRKLSQAELSRSSGISDAMISKWVNGQQAFVAGNDLAKICACLTSKPKERAELVRAHLYDEMGGPGSELIEIRIHGQTTYLRETEPAYRAALPLNLRRAFELLAAECLTDADVRNVILSLANLLAPEVSSAEKADHDETVQTLAMSYKKKKSPASK